MDDLNSVILEGTLVGSYDNGRTGRFAEHRIDIVSQRSTPRLGRKSGHSRFTVDLSRVSLLGPQSTLRRGARLRIVGFLDRPERGQALVIAEHLEVKPASRSVVLAGEA